MRHVSVSRIATLSSLVLSPILAILAIFASPAATSTAFETATALVTVYVDHNENGVRDPGEEIVRPMAIAIWIQGNRIVPWSLPDPKETNPVPLQIGLRYILKTFYRLLAPIPPGNAADLAGWAFVDLSSARANSTILVDIGLRQNGQRPNEFALPDGYFFTMANGFSGVGTLGFSITNGGDIPFWEKFRRLGGVDTLGFPASRRFMMDGFAVQVTQGALFQWRPERNEVVLANVFELMERAGLDDTLYARGVPRPIKDDGSGGNFRKAQEIRLGWLTNDGIKAKFLAKPNPDAISSWDLESSIQLYGLPMSMPERLGPFITQRFQRVALQLWVDSQYRMPVPGTVVRVLGGDLMKEFGMVPAEATAPQPPPVPAPPATGA